VIRLIISLFLIALLSWVQAGLADSGVASDPSVLTLKAVEGNGATYAPGSRATRGVAVVVMDETGRPVDGATVSFTLPMTGPSGEFASGGRTEIVTTRADGRASVWGMRWNRLAGPFEIRVSAARGPARASMALAQSLAGAPSKSDSLSTSASGGNHKWLWIALGGAAAVAGAVVAGLAAKDSSGSSASTAASAVQIGTPSISLGRP
jgi:hypothetical protein